MLKFYKNTEIEREKWDNLIQNSINNIVYAEYWYLDIVCNNWGAIIEDDYKSALVFAYGKKYGFWYIYPPFFVQQLGLFSNDKEKSIDAFLDAIPDKFLLHEMYLNVDNKDYPNKNYQSSLRTTFHLNLNDDYANLKSAYSTNLKRNIKKAEKGSLLFSNNACIQDGIAIFKKSAASKKSLWKKSDYTKLRNLLEKAKELGKLESFKISNSEEDLCFGFFLISGKRRIFIFSSTAENARNTGALHYLIDNYIKQNSQSENYIDFEGSMDENLARFYKGFNAKKQNFWFIRKNDLPIWVNILKRIR